MKGVIPSFAKFSHGGKTVPSGRFGPYHQDAIYEVNITRCPVDPVVVVSVECHNKDKNKKGTFFTSHLIIPMGKHEGMKRVRNVRAVARDGLTTDIDGNVTNGGDLEIQMEIQGAIGINLKRRSKDISDISADMLEHLHGVSFDKLGTEKDLNAAWIPITVTKRVNPTEKDTGNATTFLRLLNHCANFDEHHMYPYRSNKGNPMMAFNAQIKREVIQRKSEYFAFSPMKVEGACDDPDFPTKTWPLHCSNITEGGISAYPSTDYYKTIEEYLVVHGYGLITDFLHGDKMRRLLELSEHEVCFVVTGDEIATAHLRYNIEKMAEQSKLPGTREVIDTLKTTEGQIFTVEVQKENANEKTKIKVATTHPGTALQEMHGHVIGTVLGMPPHFFSEDAKKEKFTEGSLGVRTGAAPKFHPCRISIKPQTAALRHQLATLQGLTKKEKAGPLTDRLINILLNQEPTQPNFINPVAGLPNLTEEQWVANWNLVRKTFGRILNEEQLKALLMAIHLPNGFGILEGFPGCGKTYMLAMLAMFYLLCGVSVACIAPTHPAVDNMVKVFGEVFADGEGPQDLQLCRVHRALNVKKVFVARALVNPADDAVVEDASEDESKIPKESKKSVKEII